MRKGEYATNNFSYSYRVFYNYVELCPNFIKLKIVICKVFEFRRVLILLFGKGLIISKQTVFYPATDYSEKHCDKKLLGIRFYCTMRTFNNLGKKPFEHIVRKEKMLKNGIYCTISTFNDTTKETL